MNLQVTQARCRLGYLRGEELPDIAVAMLQCGFDSQALRELAALDRPTLRDAGELFERALEELDQPRFTVPVAREILLRELLTDIISGRIDPGEGARELWARAHDFETEDAWTVFIALYSEYEDHPAKRAVLGARIRAAAETLLVEHQSRSA